MNIYVSKLNFRTTGESLQALFAQYGEVSSANIITDRETGRSRGFGFVEMPDEGQGQSAIDALNGTDFEGMTIIVNVARPKTEHGNGRRLRRQPRRRWLQPRRLRQKTVLTGNIIPQPAARVCFDRFLRLFRCPRPGESRSVRPIAECMTGYGAHGRSRDTTGCRPGNTGDTTENRRRGAGL